MKLFHAALFLLALAQPSVVLAREDFEVRYISSRDTTLIEARADSVKDTARQMVGDDKQFQCVDEIVQRESGWDQSATNAASGAYGLFQALPPSRMNSAGPDWRTNPRTQIKWGLDYIKSRYGTPCAALAFRRVHGWY
ncbi:hypothetical protein BDV19DRAFT_389280 [Aspergillus venezuelensis]